jgi:hypothetical protein
VLSAESKTAPPLASGLPFLYSTPNEDRYLERDSFDPWNPMPSCDIEHYFSCSTFTPAVGIKRKVWEAIAPFNRKWFMWLDSRTANPWDYNLYIEGVKNADYMQYQLPHVEYRYDLWKLENYSSGVLDILHEFLSLNPQIAEDIAYTKECNEFTVDNLTKLLKNYQEEWYGFACKKTREIFLEQNKTFTKLNAKFKRSYYGPFSVYTSPYKTYNVMKHFGLDAKYDVSELYTGFMQFEDYPFSCSYPVYRGAFAAMTIKLHQPKLKLYPEVYGCKSYGGCPDGLVAFANPPLGVYVMPEYFLVTQCYEYAFTLNHWA